MAAGNPQLAPQMTGTVARTLYAPGLRLSAERLRCAMLWLTAASGAIVFVEPSPYEVVSFLAMTIFLASGLTLSPALLPLASLLILINIGYCASGAAVIGENGVVLWLLTSWYLAATAIFFAAVLGNNCEARIRAIAGGCIAGGVIASLAAIIGYSRLVPELNDMLLLYGRARGTFKDPNVLGAFMVLPALLALQMTISEHFWRAVAGAILLGLFAIALLLSFSRAAWGQTVFGSLLLLTLVFLTTRSSSQRLRIVVLAGFGAMVLAAGLAALLSIEMVADLFKQRASLAQDYDLGAQGRFARFSLGAILALDAPLGIGPLQFNKYFPEDPHNSYLNAFMAGGWLSGVCYPILVALTLLYGLRTTFVRTPWQPAAIVVFSAYCGLALESIVIDSDHWRHGFLLLGLQWGLIAATRTYIRRDQREKYG
jgi:hypothetical protein